VGQDAERIFARPHIGRCDPSYGFPHKYGAAHPAIEFDIGDGAGFHHVAPTDGSYHPDHTYTYVVIGHDQPLQVKLLDQPYSDNYGDLEIDVTPISQ
jgi:hypothetical protein